METSEPVVYYILITPNTFFMKIIEKFIFLRIILLPIKQNKYNCVEHLYINYTNKRETELF